MVLVITAVRHYTWPKDNSQNINQLFLEFNSNQLFLDFNSLIFLLEAYGFRMRILIVILFSFLLYACGGGGGGSSSSSSAINWTTSVSGSTTARYLLQSGDTFNYVPNGNVTFSINSSSDTLIASSNSYGYYDPPELSSRTMSGSASASTGTDTQSTNSSVNLTSTHYDYSYTDGAYGDTVLLIVAIPTNYSNQAYLVWSANDRTFGTGYKWFAYSTLPFTKTPYASLPASGTATYNGAIDGIYNIASAANFYNLGGDAAFSADWSAKTISGSFSNLSLVEIGGSGNMSFPSLTMSSTSIQNSNDDAIFSGSLSGASVGGSISGWFLGNSYEELGGTWRIHTSNYCVNEQTAANCGVGVFSAKK